MARALAVGVFSFLIAARAHAADTGQFQLLLAAPDPVLAGEKVTFQTIAVNKGTAIWRAKKFYLQAEIYDDNRTYLARTERFRGATDVNPGQSVLANLSFELPVNYAGRYHYRVFLMNNEQRVLESDYLSFQVRERPVVPSAPPPMAIGGNVILSYRNQTGPDPYVGNISLNMIGRVNDKSFLFNAYTFHDPKDSLDFYTVLLNYYGPDSTLGLGDVSPSFSPLSVSGQGMRGGQLEVKKQLGGVGVEIQAVGGRTATSEEGNATTDGVFRRMLYGGKAEFLLPGRLSVFTNYMTSADADDSLDVPGPTLAPVSDRVAGGGMTWEFLPRVKLTGEFQSSSFKSNTLSTAAAVTDDAWRTSLAVEREKFTFNGYVQRTGTDFVNLGAPNVPKDRFTYDAGATYMPWSWLNLYSSFNQYRDNLKNNTALVTTTQRIMSNGVSFSLPSQTGFNLGYSVNSAVGDPRTAQDNETVTTSLGVTQGWRGQSLALSYQSSDFMDKTKTTNDLITTTLGTALNLSFGGRVSSSLGATMSSTEDQIDSSTQETQSFSASLNVEIVKNKLLSQVWGAMTATEDNDTVNRADRQTQNANIEFTWQVKPSTALTLGAFRNATTDAIIPANDLSSNGANARVSYSF